MDILTVVVVFLVLEVAICGICCFVCRERHLPHERDKQPNKMSHHPPLHPSRVAHGVDHQKAWAHATDSQIERPDSISI